MDYIQSAISDAITDVFEGEEVGTFTSDSDLVNDIGLDSIQLVNLLLTLEDKLDMVIDFDEFDFDEITTVGSLAEFIKELKKDAS